MDLLSSNPVLGKVLEYVEPKDILNCKTVSRSLQQTIQRHSKNLARPAYHLSIYSSLTNSATKENSVVLEWSRHRVNYWNMLKESKSRAEIYGNFMTFSGPDADKFFSSLKQATGDILMKTTGFNINILMSPTNSSGITVTHDDFMQSLGDVLKCLLSSIEVCNFKLIEDGPESNLMKLCPFSTEQLTCIRDCLLECRPKSRQATAGGIEISPTTTEHWQILKAVDLNDAVLTLNASVVSDYRLLEMPNVRGKVTIKTAANNMASLRGIRILLREMSLGKRTTKELTIDLGQKTFDYHKWPGSNRWPFSLRKFTQIFPSSAKMWKLEHDEQHGCAWTQVRGCCRRIVDNQPINFFLKHDSFQIHNAIPYK